MSFFRNKREEVKAGDTVLDSDFTEVTNDDGTKEIVTVAQLKEARKAQKAEELANAKKNEKMVGDDEEVEVDGEKVNMAALKECYANMKKNEKKNAEDEKAEKDKKDKEEKDKKKEDEKENAAKQKLIDEVSNAGGKKIVNTGKIETMQDRQKRGSNRYGSAKK